MSWDSKATVASRRRGNSIHNRASSLSASLTLQQKAGAPSVSPSVVQPTSAHVADPFLQDFLQPSFDPAAYWNRTLANAPSTSTTSPPAGATGRSGSGAASRLAAAATSATATADRAAQAQTTLSQLGAHTSRLTTVLTQLTDDILRSGSRLAYEVELLRGETISLAELVQQQAAVFDAADAVDAQDPDEQPENEKTADPSEPASLAQLRMLAQVRASLDAVIRTFGDAMEFVMPPSAMSVTASFLSVSGPDQDSRRRSSTSSESAAAAADGHATASSTNSMEDKGQQVLRTKRDEVAKLLAAATIDDGDTHMPAAVERVAALQTLCQVWTGTAEEKARTKFVDGLQRLVDERQRELEREREKLEQRQRQQQEKQEKRERETAAAKTATGGDAVGAPGSQGLASQSASSSGQDARGAQGTQEAGGVRGYAAAGYGFISQLQKIRSGL